jgi:hypothetical protein
MLVIAHAHAHAHEHEHEHEHEYQCEHVLDEGPPLNSSRPRSELA